MTTFIPLKGSDITFIPLKGSDMISSKDLDAKNIKYSRSWMANISHQIIHKKRFIFSLKLEKFQNPSQQPQNYHHDNQNLLNQQNIVKILIDQRKYKWCPNIPRYHLNKLPLISQQQFILNLYDMWN